MDKLINLAVPGTIDERAINKKRVLNPWERNENHTLCLNSYQLGYIFISTDINNFLLGSMCNVDIEMLSLLSIMQTTQYKCKAILRPQLIMIYLCIGVQFLFVHLLVRVSIDCSCDASMQIFL
jgi:hypothetical protein